MQIDFNSEKKQEQTNRQEWLLITLDSVVAFLKKIGSLIDVISAITVKFAVISFFLSLGLSFIVLLIFILVYGFIAFQNDQKTALKIFSREKIYLFNQINEETKTTIKQKCALLKSNLEQSEQLLLESYSLLLEKITQIYQARTQNVLNLDTESKWVISQIALEGVLNPEKIGETAAKITEIIGKQTNDIRITDHKDLYYHLRGDIQSILLRVESILRSRFNTFFTERKALENYLAEIPIVFVLADKRELEEQIADILDSSGCLSGFADFQRKSKDYSSNWTLVVEQFVQKNYPIYRPRPTKQIPDLEKSKN